MKQSMSILVSSESVEWYTPPEYIEAARRVMGSIDLDPASSAIANKIVGADKYITRQENGLELRWNGNVWLNSPYGKTGNKSNQDIWTKYLLHEYMIGNVKNAIVITNAAPGYHWWDDLFAIWPGPMCITRGRIKFIKEEWMFSDGYFEYPQARDNRAKRASCFWHLGPTHKMFKEVFNDIGRVIPANNDDYAGYQLAAQGE